MAKNILIVSPKAFGYVAYMYAELQKRDNVNVSIIYLEFTGYKNIFQSIQNFVSKKIRKVNLKHNFHFQQHQFKACAQQDQILIIRPDFLSDTSLSILKGKTKNFVAFYWDSAQRIKRKQQITHFFDNIYSFDTVDVKKYKLKFITNYIFEERKKNENPEYLFFNISSNDDDYRFKQLEDFAKYLDENKWSYNFISVSKKQLPARQNNIKTVKNIVYVNEALNLIENSKIIVEFQRHNQIGLSFRVFEALGLKKKLITNNPEIVNYDFYNPNNILVIDEDNITIPKAFVNSAYEDVPNAILQKYRLENWVNTVFDLT